MGAFIERVILLLLFAAHSSRSASPRSDHYRRLVAHVRSSASADAVAAARRSTARRAVVVAAAARPSSTSPGMSAAAATAWRAATATVIVDDAASVEAIVDPSLSATLALSTGAEPPRDPTSGQLVEAAGSAARRARLSNDRVSALTVATHADGYLEVLRESCIRGGIELTVLGYGEKWGGWAWRASLVAAHLRAQPPDALVLVVDAFDVALLANERTLREAYHAFGAPIVFGCAERARVDRPFLRLWYGACGEDTLNAGGYMGRAGALLELIELYLASYADERDDQRAFTRIYAETPFFRDGGRVALDVEGSVFYNAARTLRPGTRLGLRLRDGRWRSARTDAAPCVLHAVGGGDMRHHCEAVGLDVTSVEPRNYALHLVRNEPERAALFATAAVGALLGAARVGARVLGAL